MENNEISSKLCELIESKDRNQQVFLMLQIARYIGELQGEVMALRLRLNKDLVENSKVFGGKDE